MTLARGGWSRTWASPYGLCHLLGLGPVEHDISRSWGHLGREDHVFGEEGGKQRSTWIGKVPVPSQPFPSQTLLSLAAKPPRSQPRALWLFGARAKPQDQLLSPCTGSVVSSPHSQQLTSTVPTSPSPLTGPTANHITVTISLMPGQPLIHTGLRSNTFI